MAAWLDIVLDTWTQGQRLSAVGPGDVRTHVELADGLIADLETPARAVDIGTGAGIPGLLAAGRWPDTEFLLVDAAARRVALVQHAVERLGWGPRVQVIHDRAESVGRMPSWRATADLVLARSFGPPATVAECGAPLLRPGGELVVSEPPEPDPDRWPAAGLSMLGLVTVDEPERTPRRRRLRLDSPIDDRYPRRPGIPSKRPLFT